MLDYVVDNYHPDLLLAGMPTTDEFQHQFLGLVSPKLPNGAANPASTTSTSTASPTAASPRARATSARRITSPTRP